MFNVTALEHRRTKGMEGSQMTSRGYIIQSQQRSELC